MTAIKPNNSTLRNQIDADSYNSTLNEVNSTYTEMDKYIGNLSSDIQSVLEFENDIIEDQKRGYDIGTSLDTLGFQKDSLQIDLDFFVHMKQVYIRKLYGDLYKYCDSIIESALSIEDLGKGTSKEIVKERKFRNMPQYPPKLIDNPNSKDEEGNLIDGEPEQIPDPYVKYDMNQIFSLINCITSNLRELADDIGTFDDTAREARGFSVGNLIMNLDSQKQKLSLEFSGYISRLSQFLQQNKDFSSRCLKRIQLISSEIVTEDEQKAAEQNNNDDDDAAV